MVSPSDKLYGDRYQVNEKLARGGMAEVFEAHDTLLDRPVALKVLFPELSTNESFVARFRREAQAAANLSHPNIVSVFDWGSSENTYYIVMELVEGKTLSKVIRESAPLEPKVAAAIASDVAAALSFAHKNGVVHRDIKPSNVLITPDGQVKVADFGIARALSGDSDLTQTGSIMGTATYLSPEQAQGQSIDGRSDVYSLGVVLFEMITGAVPFTGDSPLAIAYRHVQEAAPLPTKFNPEIPADLEAIVMKAMAKSPEDRYQTAAEMRSDLNRFEQGKPVDAAVGRNDEATRAIPKVAKTITIVDEPDTIDFGALSYVDSGRGRRAGTIILIGVLAVVILAGVAFLGGSELGLFKNSSTTTTLVKAASVTVPSVSDIPLSQAQTQLQGLGLKVSTTLAQSSRSSGTVISQTPVSGSLLSKGSTVHLIVSSGPGSVAVPNVLNQNVTAAEGTLLNAGFNVSTNYVANSAALGTVTSQTPAGGTSIAKGGTVNLVVSSGPAQVTVPNVVGLQLAQAANQLGSQQLTVGNVTYQDSLQPQGTVLDTNPPAGSTAAPNSAVDMIVSTGNAPTTTTTAPTTTTTSSTTTTVPSSTTTTSAG